MNYLVLNSFPDAAIGERWNSFVADAELATHYTTPNYFADPYVKNERFAVAAVDDSDNFQAVLTGVKNGDRVTSGLFSRPQISFRKGTDVEEATEALVNGLVAVDPAAKLIDLYSWHKLNVHEMQMKPSSDATSVVMLDLKRGSEAIFADFSQTRRNELRKAERRNLLEIKEIETDAELAEIYEIHCEWNRSKGNEPDTFEQMQIAVTQRENRRVFIARAEGRVVAGSFYRLAPKGVVEYAANFSRPEYQRLRPNDVLGWHAIKWACGEGFSHFSMGGSHLFLRRFGGEVIQTYRYRRDTSLFKQHIIREKAMAIGAGAYRRLPQGFRSRLSSLVAK